MPTVYNDRTTLQLVDDASEAIRGVCHLTHSDDSLDYPSDAYNGIAGLATVAFRMRQAVEQIDRIVATWTTNGHIAITTGEHAGHPQAAAEAVSAHLREAAAALTTSGQALEQAQAALSGAAWDGPDRD